MFFRKKEAEGGSSAASGGPAAAAGTVTVSMTVNGKSVSADIDPRTLLVQFIRENQRLTGTHVGCDTSQCGACVVHLDGRATKSCTVLAATCDGGKVTTLKPAAVILADGLKWKSARVTTKEGTEVFRFDAVTWKAALPPGDYVVEVDGNRFPFPATEGEEFEVRPQ